MILTKGDIEQAAKYTDPRVHQYIEEADEWLYCEFANEIRYAKRSDAILAVFKNILALGISIGDVSVGYGWDQL